MCVKLEAFIYITTVGDTLAQPTHPGGKRLLAKKKPVESSL